MNCRPNIASKQESKESLLARMKLTGLHQIPLVNEAHKIVGLEIIDYLIVPAKYDNWVVLMAGGLGTRLRPLTEDMPKPLLRIGGRPILETILENFVEAGFRRFFIAINYKGELIERYFGDGSRWGVELCYLQEKQILGTAGPLGLLPEKPSLPVVVMNGDILTKVNFKQLLDFHAEHGAQATMCVREYNYQVPYGVVKMDRHRLVTIEEKPVQRFFVNAGVYVLCPDVLDFIPFGSPCDMPDLFKKLITEQRETAVFPIREYWLDIGRMDDFEQAEVDFGKVFI
jgi:NDP-sugar pyrophosphorylase family protein